MEYNIKGKENLPTKIANVLDIKERERHSQTNNNEGSLSYQICPTRCAEGSSSSRNTLMSKKKISGLRKHTD